MSADHPLFDDPTVSDDPIAVAWRKYHEAHPEVYELFTRFALEVVAKGRKRFSARAIFHRIRWYTQIEAPDGTGFKINNNHSPFYARLFALDHAEHANLFRTREASADHEVTHG